MKTSRINRIKIFDDFYDKSKEIFETLRDNDNRVEIFENEYMLNICPGSRDGGQEKRIVEVFWGARPYEFETKGKDWKSLTETGATLFIYRNDTGHLTISLSPAKTENIKPIEDSIAIYKWLDPKKLKEDKFIKSLWNDFIAYMEFTSLDGTPTIKQKIRISYLRYFKNLVIDKKWQPTKISIFSKDVLKFLLTVGLSGFIFFFVSILREPNENIINTQLKKLNDNEELMIEQIDKLLKSEEFISSTSSAIDTINSKLSELKESIINNNQDKRLKYINRNLNHISNQIKEKSITDK